MDSKERRREQQRLAAERRRRKNGVKQCKGTKAVCEQCGSEYIRQGIRSKTCGEECAKERSRERARKVSRQKARERGAPKFGEKLTCAHCKNIFERDASRVKYCKECRILQKKSALPKMRKHHNEYRKGWHKEKMKTDPVYACAITVRGSICDAIRRMGYTKNNRSQEILGCTWEEFKDHIERQFIKGMSWENRGEWHIDHIVPISSATTEQEVIELNHFTNLRPLWASENQSKCDKREFLI